NPSALSKLFPVESTLPAGARTGKVGKLIRQGKQKPKPLGVRPCAAARYTMRRRSLGHVALAALAFLLLPAPSPAQLPLGLDGHGEKKFEDFDKLVKGAKEYDGLFKLFKKEDKLYAELKPMQLDRP